MSPNPSRTPWKVADYRGDFGMPGCFQIQDADGHEICGCEYITPYAIGPSRKERDTLIRASENAGYIVAAVNEKAERAARAAETEQDFNRITEVPNGR